MHKNLLNRSEVSVKGNNSKFCEVNCASFTNKTEQLELCSTRKLYSVFPYRTNPAFLMWQLNELNSFVTLE